MNNKKGQAALEFLMTYGWAILVVLAAIGALAYFGVLSPSKYIPDTCIASTGYTCEGKPVITSSSITFSITNKNPSTLLFNTTYQTTLSGTFTGGCTMIACDKGFTSGGTCNTATTTKSVAQDTTVTVYISGCTPSQSTIGTAIKQDVKIGVYDSASGLTTPIIIGINGKTQS